MKVIPAIDLIEGRVVRLRRGDYDAKTVYHYNPLEVAQRWVEAGCERMHIVDLDGAKAGHIVNYDIAKHIKQKFKIEVQYGGGVRTISAVNTLLNDPSALDYVILGTRAIEDTDFLKEAVQLYGSKIIVGIDVEGDTIKTAGWLKAESKRIDAVLRDIESTGVKTIICTDITKDGTLEGIGDKAAALSMVESGFDVILAGGVSTIKDIEFLAKRKSDNLRGVIVGKALYEETLDLKEAIKICLQNE